MIDLLVIAALFLAGLGLGRLGARLVSVEATSRLEAVIFEIALGWVGLSMSFFAVGLLGWLRAELVWGLILPLAVLGAYFQSELLRLDARSRFSLQALSYLEWLILLLSGALFVIVLLAALAPPSGQGAGWDGLSYHLTTIKLFVEQGRIVFIPFITNSNYPMGMDILFTPGLMLGHAASAQVLHFSMGLLVAMAMASLAARYANRALALSLPALFFAIPLVQNEATWPMVDLGVALYTCLALLALINWQESEHRSWLVIAGVMIGFACSVKMTAIFGVAALGLVLVALILAKRPRHTRDWVVLPLLFGGSLLLFGAPWYIKNYVMVGNPFMPFFTEIFGGANWSPEVGERFRVHMAAYGLARFHIPFVVFPTASVSCLLMAGLLALKIRYRPVFKIVWSYILLYLALWLVSGSPQQRFLLPVYPLVILLMLWFASVFTRRLVVLQSALYAIVVLVLVFSLGNAVRTKGDMLAVGLGLESKEAFLNRKLYSYSAFQFANTQLAGSTKFFIFPENRTYYLNQPYIWGDPVGPMIDYTNYNSPSDLLDGLEALGITHIILLRPAYPFWRHLAASGPQLASYVEHAFELVDGLNSLGLSEVFSANGVTIYALPTTLELQ